MKKHYFRFSAKDYELKNSLGGKQDLCLEHFDSLTLDFMVRTENLAAFSRWPQTTLKCNSLRTQCSTCCTLWRCSYKKTTFLRGRGTSILLYTLVTNEQVALLALMCSRMSVVVRRHFYYPVIKSTTCVTRCFLAFHCWLSTIKVHVETTEPRNVWLQRNVIIPFSAFGGRTTATLKCEQDTCFKR